MREGRASMMQERGILLFARDEGVLGAQCCCFINILRG